MSDFGSLLLGAIQSVSTVACVAGVGAYACWRGVLTPVALKQLDKLVSEVLTPAMVFYKVVPNVSLDTLLMIWPMTVTSIVVVFSGLAIDYATSAVLSMNHSEAFPRFRGLLMVALAFPNSFAIPLTLQLTLADQSVFHQGDTPDADSVRDRTMSLYLFSYVVWIFMRWSVGYPVLTGAMQDFNSWIKKVVNPPTIACVVASLIGFIKAGLIPDGATNWLTPAGTALHYISNALVPTIQMCLGAKLYMTVTRIMAQRRKAHEYEAADPGASDLELKGEDSLEIVEKEPTIPQFVYLLIVVLRQGVGMMLAAFMGYILSRGAGVTDNVALMVCMMQTAGPPMINMSVMAGLSGECEKEASLAILYTYSASIITWTLGITVFLSILPS
eukprot:TRINITY_DN49594_c0_g1_i1.p1 TRINITY_DN49594_c0_g1~~TRINITY_DN49594_c0_g1_i1.p1  ORF type:complete len:386 (-),score=65.41 TRINITY_DN49594_c0_g1_i1:61-1218(-)